MKGSLEVWQRRNVGTSELVMFKYNIWTQGVQHMTVLGMHWDHVIEWEITVYGRFPAGLLSEESLGCLGE